MKKNNHFTFKCFLFLLFLGFSEILAAQNAFSSGTDAQSAAGSVSYSVGQMTYQSIESASGKVSQGVHQPYEIFVLSTNENAMQKNITVYPNPVKDFLIVDFNAEKLKNARYQLFDASGKLINQGELKALKNDINTSAIRVGMYILSISSEGKTMKTFKIIKN
ncbi:Por secretion system C-terminal sorting domain-containing protein [Halpernia humi]|uniref:Por secretion system C-terminal sorting domain-containing protein n=1 Tax=Halpernia humi TaxID=493375 RepID=A0A1H6A5J1_9FLAO|nr:T9SS type A sorting domain-containing protein [Halpernia humi]SEG43315.1 Por secretion system C-terminal sorting domain-containing protein [Halpernia humi]